MGIFKDVKNAAKDMKDLADTGKQMQAEKYGTTNPFKQMGQGLSEANAAVQSLQAEQAKMQHLLANGIAGTGVIKELRDTGMQVNYQPQFDIDLVVTIEGREPYDATIRQVVAMSVLPQFQPGAVMPVHVDPADTSSLMIG